ncbi:MAG: hypothetical protein Q9170_005749 [Blastenia crenularia]
MSLSVLQSLTADPDQLLDHARRAIIASINKTQEAEEQSAQDVDSIWAFLKQYEQDHPHLTDAISNWRRAIYDAVGENEIIKRLQNAEALRKRIHGYQQRVVRAWKLPLPDVLHPYDFSAFSKATWQGLARIAEHIPKRDKAISRLQDSIKRRLNGKRTAGVRLTKGLTFDPQQPNGQPTAERRDEPTPAPPPNQRKPAPGADKAYRSRRRKRSREEADSDEQGVFLSAATPEIRRHCPQPLGDDHGDSVCTSSELADAAQSSFETVDWRVQVDGAEDWKDLEYAEPLHEAPSSISRILRSRPMIREVLTDHTGYRLVLGDPLANDLDGAVRSLRGWLITEAVQRVLDVCADLSCRVLDGSYLSSVLSDQREKDAVRLQPHERTVLAPIHHHDHWTLVVFALDEKRICHFDSLRRPTGETKTAALGFAERLDDAGGWAFDEMDCPKQSNSSDCGVHVIVVALYWITALEAPRAINCQVWRFVFTVLLEADSGQASECRSGIAVNDFEANISVLPQHRPFPSRMPSADEVPEFMRENRHHRTGVSSLLHDVETAYLLLNDLIIKKHTDSGKLRDQLNEAERDMEVFKSIGNTITQLSSKSRPAHQRFLQESTARSEREHSRIEQKQALHAERLNQLQRAMTRVQLESAECHSKLVAISRHAETWLEEEAVVFDWEPCLQPVVQAPADLEAYLEVQPERLDGVKFMELVAANKAGLAVAAVLVRYLEYTRTRNYPTGADGPKGFLLKPAAVYQ